MLRSKVGIAGLHWDSTFIIEELSLNFAQLMLFQLVKIMPMVLGITSKLAEIESIPMDIMVTTLF